MPIFPRHSRTEGQTDSARKRSSRSYLSGLLELPGICRRFSISSTRTRKNLHTDDGPTQTVRPSLDAVQIPSYRLFSANEDIENLSFSIQSTSTSDESKKQSDQNCKIKSPTPPVTSSPLRPPPAPSTPNKSILRSHAQTPTEHTSPADTLANTSRNIEMTSTIGVPHPLSLRKRISEARRRCYSVCSVSFLPFPGLPESGMLGATINKPHSSKSNGGDSSRPDRIPESSKKTVHFGHVDTHPYSPNAFSENTGDGERRVGIPAREERGKKREKDQVLRASVQYLMDGAGWFSRSKS
ncbi:hypothetical protein VTO42DRAFT_1690 [Malbranchea cinnamomea]